MSGQSPQDWPSSILTVAEPGVRWDMKSAASSIINATQQPIWEETGDYTPQDTAELLTIESTSDNDIFAGSGLTSVLVEGIGEGGSTEQELILMNGTAGRTTTRKFFNVHHCLGSSNGTGFPILGIGGSGSSEGIIRIKSSTTDDVLGRIDPGHNATRQAIYRCPVDERWIFHFASLTPCMDKEINVTFFVKESDSDTWLSYAEPILAQNPFAFPSPFVLTGGQQLIVTASATPPQTCVTLISRIFRAGFEPSVVFLSPDDPTRTI